MIKEYRFDILKFIFDCIEMDIPNSEIRKQLESWVVEVINTPIYFTENSMISDNTGYLIHKEWCREVN